MMLCYDIILDYIVLGRANPAALLFPQPIFPVSFLPEAEFRKFVSQVS